MYSFIIQFHSSLAYIVVFLYIIVLAQYFVKTTSDLSLRLISLISIHIQFVVGLILLFISPIVHHAFADMAQTMKSAELRLMAVEHPTVMLIVVILSSLAYLKAKKNPVLKWNVSFWLYVSGFVLLLSRLPWKNWFN
jgi:hypothetical protein